MNERTNEHENRGMYLAPSIELNIRTFTTLLEKLLAHLNKWIVDNRKSVKMYGAWCRPEYRAASNNLQQPKMKLEKEANDAKEYYMNKMKKKIRYTQ